MIFGTRIVKRDQFLSHAVAHASTQVRFNFVPSIDKLIEFPEPPFFRSHLQFSLSLRPSHSLTLSCRRVFITPLLFFPSRNTHKSVEELYSSTDRRECSLFSPYKSDQQTHRKRISVPCSFFRLQ